MSLKVKYTDEHGILHINMSPTNSKGEDRPEPEVGDRTDIIDPKFDTINNRFSQYDLFGSKYDVETGGDSPPSLFRSRYNSIEEELANTPYAFATERSLRLNAANPLLDITIKSRDKDVSPSRDLEDDRFFKRNLNVEYNDGLFGPQLDFQAKSTVKERTSDEDSPAFTVTQLIHAQDRYFNLSSRQSSSVVDSPKNGSIKSVSSNRVRSISSIEVKSAPGSAKKERTVTILEQGRADDAFKVLSSAVAVKASQPVEHTTKNLPVVPTSKRKKESSFAILTETPTASRPSSPRSLPVETRPGRSTFKGRGFREETSRHNTPKTSAANSRAGSPPRRRTRSLSRIDRMAQAAALTPAVHNLSRPHSPRDFVKENIEEVRELSELNREKHEAEAEKRKREEEEALLKEMGLLDKNLKGDLRARSLSRSRTSSRSNSPPKMKLRSRSNSPSAILHYENISATSKEFINAEDGLSKPVMHESRQRTVTRSEPQSNNGSPKHSKIPKRQNSVSPARTANKRDISNSRRVDNKLNKNQKFISNSTSSIHETIKVGSSIHDKRDVSKSTQYLSISPAHIKGKPPISPGRGGPPPSNKAINSKRLSPIVGTPNKSPIEDLKPSSAKTPTKTSPAAKKPVKTTGNTPTTSKLNSRQPSRRVSRDPSPNKRKTLTNKSSTTTPKPSTRPSPTKPLNKAPSSTRNQNLSNTTKPEPKKPINRTSSLKSLTRTPSTKTLNEKPPLVKRNSRKDIKALSTTKINEIGTKKESGNKELKSEKSSEKAQDTGKDTDIKKEQTEGEEKTKNEETTTDGDSSPTKQDSETQYDKIVNEKGELVILTKKNIVSMTTAAITAQPLEVVTTVTNQLPSAFEKAREKGIFERLSSRDSLAPKEEVMDQKHDGDPIKEKQEKEDENITEKDIDKATEKSNDKITADKEKINDHKVIKPIKNHVEKALFTEDNIKLKPLQPPYNAQVERVKQKIDNILKEPEVSSANILGAATVAKERKNMFKNVADKTRMDIRDTKNEITNKFTEIKDQAMKDNDKMAADIRSEATKIVNSIITPVEEPKEVQTKVKEEIKKNIEPIIMVVNEKTKNGPNKGEIVEKMTETLVKGEADIEVQSSNLSTPGMDKMAVKNKIVDGSNSDKSAHSNGGFPQSTSTTPKPPLRTKPNQQTKEEENTQSSKDDKEPQTEPLEKKPNICKRFIGKCKTKCCPCCIKAEDNEKELKHEQNNIDIKEKEHSLTTQGHDLEAPPEKKKGIASKLNCCKKTEKEVEDKISIAEKALEKTATIEFEDETKRKRKFRDVLCCGRRRRVSDVSDAISPRNIGDVTAPAAIAGTDDVTADTGCCGKKKREVERRDSILSDRPPPSFCGRIFSCMCCPCRRQSEPASSSRRTSLFSKNKSLSPTLPPEDNRPKLDSSLVEHTSVMRGAIPLLPIVLASFCLFCNIVVPGLGTVLSGIFCLCFGIPRFGVHDGAKHRIGSFLINLLVGCGQLFTVMFCLVGWGWSIWWGVIMVRTSRKYRKLRAEAAAEEAEAAPPVTANNHTRA